MKSAIILLVLVVVAASALAQQGPVVTLQASSIGTPQAPQVDEQPVGSEVKHIGMAEARSVFTPARMYPALHPKVYWHDEDWKLDMLPQPTADSSFAMQITCRGGSTQIAELSKYYAQIDSISRAPNDKAIVIADINGKITSLGIVDLKLGIQVDDLSIVAPAIAPNRRFVLYVNTDFRNYYNYRLYDASKTPLENTCGYRDNDPEHKDLDESYRGFQIYPRRAAQLSCYDKDLKAFDDESHVRASDFIWSDDSSKAVFADVLDGRVMSLVLAYMPTGIKDIPVTSTYQLVGAEDVCRGAQYCDYNNVRSLVWEDETVKAVLLIRPRPGKPIERDLTIPLSKFVPVGR